jgi:hypothetical protein
MILSGLVSYLLLAICCNEKYEESVSITRVCQLRNQLRDKALQYAAGYGAMLKRSECQRR